MAKISAITKQEKYKVEIHSLTGNSLIADEPVEMGGMNMGFSPKELLASSLAACTSITLKMYAAHKAWDLKEVKVDIALDFYAGENKTVINRKIDLTGDLDEAQKRRLLAVANACPVHKMLTNPVEISTIITDLKL
ncbi:OsmC family peroxiredoxin [Mucilaginibacter hurinus]|uniref:OsmC family peroxiredoxin n=1 Tax=Mucilaginibacter hurinus TaxID=2201324 RepID=A0A367GSV0_9SPHI|nr:OsmC family protein [Mucilaginibacter hurinus]RCH56504.1 OsmC family peroxiredoxin [Mucilaginibacter hurinus]